MCFRLIQLDIEERLKPQPLESILGAHLLITLVYILKRHYITIRDVTLLSFTWKKLSYITKSIHLKLTNRVSFLVGYNC